MVKGQLFVLFWVGNFRFQFAFCAEQQSTFARLSWFVYWKISNVDKKAVDIWDFPWTNDSMVIPRPESPLCALKGVIWSNPKWVHKVFNLPNNGRKLVTNSRVRVGALRGLLRLSCSAFKIYAYYLTFH